VAPRAPASVSAAALPPADSLRTTALAPGVDHHFLWMARGPWAIHILSVQLSQCSPALRAAKAGPPIAQRATTSALASGLAAINADFFELPRGTTVGAHVTGGRVVMSPQQRPVFAVTDRGFSIGLATLDAFIAEAVDTFRLRHVNRPSSYSATLFDAWFGGSVTDSATPALRVRLLAPGRGVIAGVAASGEASVVDTANIVVTGTGAWGTRRAVGDTLVWRARVLAANGEAATEVVGGFPLLVEDGKDVLAWQPGVRPAFGDQRHPRTAIAWNAETLFWILVDGRQPPYSDGMSLPELTQLALELRATHAINLDGGGSSTLVINGRIVNRPSDTQGERAVANALVLESCRLR
jgi:hypothetical protein